ncbi:fluG-like protein [Drosera capensis]
MAEKSYVELKAAIEEATLIDAHAHNVVAVDSSLPFVKCFSEADGDALAFAPHSLSFKRGLKELGELYGCGSTLSEIELHRKQSGLESISKTCFGAARISALLIDDGIEFDKNHEIEWHKSYVPIVGRILRIERWAEQILDQGTPDASTWVLDKFTEIFVGRLKSYPFQESFCFVLCRKREQAHLQYTLGGFLSNRVFTVAATLVGLKSIAAYRSGLEIDTTVSNKAAEEGLRAVLSGGKPVRITNKSFIDYVFTRSLEVAQSFNLPVQIHTGFGDKDLDLRLANPLHLRAVLEDERFSKCRIVLLHASYPFSKEASYLASVYQQVYLDFGLAIPKLSVHGMISSVKELLELAPVKKVMFSTDGYAFPETFYLGAKRAREVIFSVLRDACEDGDLSVPEAVEAANDIFFQNALQFYKINTSSSSSNGKMANSHNVGKIGLTAPPSDVTFVRVFWVDTSGQCRCRAVPKKRFHDVITKNGLGLTFASMGMSSFSDGPAVETKLTGVGEIRLIPDLSTQRRVPWTKKEEMVLADMHVKPGEPWDYCPREALRRVLKVLKDEFNLEINAGFENEFFMFKEKEGTWVPFDSTPYCSAAAFDAASPILHEVYEALVSLGVAVEQIHAEAGKGQYELALKHASCFRAADNLIFTREVIKAVARKHGLLATFLPKYSLEDIGSGSHVHLSLWQNGVNVFMGASGTGRHGMSKVGEEFMAGVLHHLPAILAFTAPHPNSYDRIQPDTWSGAYQCWGKENREAPLRTACPPGVPDGIVSNFEIKAFDGCANPYLGLASIVAAGVDGLRSHLPLPDPIDTNPSDLEGKLHRLPTSLSGSLEALEKDDIFKDLIGEKLLVAVKGVRKAEIDYYSKNNNSYKDLIYKY